MAVVQEPVLSCRAVSFNTSHHKTNLCVNNVHVATNHKAALAHVQCSLNVVITDFISSK